MMKLVLSEEISDSAVWQAVLAGDQYAFELLFKRCYDDLYLGAVTYNGNSDLAEDHIQELFVKIWECRERLEEVEEVRTYLWTALRGCMIDSFRKNRAGERYYDQWEKSDCQMHYPVEELIVHDELGAVPSTELMDPVNQLTPHQREALYLKFYEPFPDPNWKKAWKRLKNRLEPDSRYADSSNRKISLSSKSPKEYLQWILRVVTLFILSL